MEPSVSESFVEPELDTFLLISFWKNFLALPNFVSVGFEGCRGLVTVGEACFLSASATRFLRSAKSSFKVEKSWCSAKRPWPANGMDGTLWSVCTSETLMSSLDS